MPRHRRFEEICALAALGQAAEAEFAELAEHCVQCSSCAAAYREFRQLLHHDLPPADATREPWFGRLGQTEGYRERFLARARAEGVNFSDECERAEPTAIWTLSWLLRPQLATAALVLLLVAGAGVMHWLRTDDNTMANESEAAMLELRSQNEELLRQLTQTQAATLDYRVAMEKSREQHSEAQRRTRTLIAKLEASTQETHDLRQSYENARLAFEQMERDLSERQRLASDLSRQVGELRASALVDRAMLAAQEHRLQRLQEEILLNAEMLDRQRKLLAAGREIRDLMGARKLHIIDVFDVDGRGRNRKAFGRVFYTDGKSLIFYAFDLDEAQVADAKHSFQAWGQREDGTTTTKSLGIFYLDDREQKRWLLTFDDPAVLREIDSVFVTLEPFGGGRRPSGNKLLYAYLKNQPNHP